MNALKITVSGSYKTSNGEIVDFHDVEGVIPKVSDERAKMHVRSRYASEWVRNMVNDTDEKVYPLRIDQMRQVFIDEIQETNYDFSYVGKDIKRMSYEELQDLATAKDLRETPLPKHVSGVDLREMRQKAYLSYAKNIQGNVIDINDPQPQFATKVGNRLAFDFAKVPPLVVDGEISETVRLKMTNDEIIAGEQKNMMGHETPKDSYTLEQLKDIAKKKGITHHWNIGHDKLYNLLFG